MSDVGDQHIYDAMGVAPVVNAIGGVTLLGASSLSPRAMRAVQQANDTYMVMHEVMDRSSGTPRPSSSVRRRACAAMTWGRYPGFRTPPA